MLFTFRGNGVENERRLVKAAAEHLDVHKIRLATPVFAKFSVDPDRASEIEFRSEVAYETSGIL